MFRRPEGRMLVSNSFSPYLVKLSPSSFTVLFPIHLNILQNKLDPKLTPNLTPNFDPKFKFEFDPKFVEQLGLQYRFGSNGVE